MEGALEPDMLELTTLQMELLYSHLRLKFMTEDDAPLPLLLELFLR